MQKVHAIILASGAGSRANTETPKQFIKIAGKTVFEHTLQIFENNAKIDNIILMIPKAWREFVESKIVLSNFKKLTKILNGGNSRQESSMIGLDCIKDDNDFVLIHDAVRPFLSDRIIEDCIDALKKFNAVDVAIASADTIIEMNEDNIISNIPRRKFMLRGQTPQAFKVGTIKKAHSEATKNNETDVTDDCGLILKYSLGEIYVVHGDEQNIKITFKEDIFLAEKMFQLRTVNYPKYIEMIKLKDKVLAVFGGTSGIGKAIVDLANSNGARAYGLSRRVGVDIGKPEGKDIQESLKHIAEKEGKIDFIVISGAVLKMGTIENREITDIFEEMRINYLGTVQAVKYGIPFLKKTQGGFLLFASSSYTRGRALYSIYSSSKAAVVNFGQSLSEELSAYKIKINILCPERTSTPMRKENFGVEPEGSLLNAEKVAEASLKTLLSESSGEIINIRIDE